MTGDVTQNTEELKKVSGGSINAVLHISPVTVAKSMHLKRYGLDAKHNG
jgi:hypothetical protein